jgi:phosphoglucosamine mutase
MGAIGGGDLSRIRPFERLPQLLESVEVADRGAVEGATALWDAVRASEAALEGRGRVLVRASGTEPVVRVMVEAPSERECREILDRLVELARRELG